MNRELKFRVWDGKKLHYPEATKDEANHYLQFGTGGFWLFNEKGKMITASEVGGICDQFTGLTDKNGKDMYEGDVIRFKANYTSQPAGFMQAKIVFGEYEIELHSENGLIYSAQDETDEFPYAHCEVIGNIHQNTELKEQ